MDDGIKLWMKQNGEGVGSTRIEIIRRDSTGPNPDVAKRLAQELITRDGVHILTGFVFTPNALAVAPLITEAKVPAVIMNAATAVITTKSPYFARVSLTLPQTTEIFGRWAATKGGLKRAFTSVSDYGPGIDAEGAVSRGFTEAGGTIVDKLRVPLASPDIVPFLQRVLDAKPDGLYAFIPGGTQPPAFDRALNEVELLRAGIQLTPSEKTAGETTLRGQGDDADQVNTCLLYPAPHPSTP